MPGQIRKLGMLPLAPETKIFRAIADYFETERARGGSDLQKSNATIWTWKGTSTDVVDPSTGGNFPDFNLLPLIRITPLVIPSRWVTEQQHISQSWQVQLELFTPGTCIDDMLDFAGVVRSVLFPTDPTLIAAVKSALSFGELIRPQWSQQLGSVGIIGDSRFGLRAIASLSMATQVNTW